MEKSPHHSALKSCPDCQLAFYGSEQQWESVAHEHRCVESEGGHGGLSQCELNQILKMDIKFHLDMRQGEKFKWAPNRILPRWVPLSGDWDEEYGSELRRMSRSADPTRVTSMLRSSSEGLSFVATILYALQSLHEGAEWTKKNTLTIHVRFTAPSYSTLIY